MKIDRIDWAQSLIQRSDDSALELVAGKRALVIVNATTDRPEEAKPAGEIRVFSAANTLVYQSPLTLPTGAVPASVPDEPSFSSFYSSFVPASVIAPGMRLEVRLAGGQVAASSTPRVGLSPALEIVLVPVRIAGVDGDVDPGLADALRQVAPIASAVSTVHVPYTSGEVASLPTNESEWGNAMQKILGEINSMFVSEGADKRRQYVGYIPKRSYGVTGLAMLGGNSAVVADLQKNSQDVRRTGLHELGHGLGLRHAPCGSPTGVDPSYPYANGRLGAAGRYVWGFNADTLAFIDPRNSRLHDLMSYCDGSTFSDYNYRKIQILQTQKQARPVDDESRIPFEANVAQELLLLSGTVSGDKFELAPPKTFEGIASPPRMGPYLLRITSASGTIEQPFALDALDHDDARFIFAFSLPHPGPIQRLQILRDAQVLLDKSPSQRTTARAAGVEQRATAAATKLSEQGQLLRIEWDANAFAYLTITHLGARRTTLAQDLRGGFATISTANLPPGGSFEISLSDGLNSTRTVRAR